MASSEVIVFDGADKSMPPLVKPNGPINIDVGRQLFVNEWLISDNTLDDAFRIEARMVVWESPNVLEIPSGALFREAGEWSVFVVDGNRAKLQRVALEHRNDLEAEITEGLNEGESAVIHPSDRVQHGVRLESMK